MEIPPQNRHGQASQPLVSADLPAEHPMNRPVQLSPQPPLAAQGDAGPLSQADMAAIAYAITLRKPLVRAAHIARASAISTLLIAAIALPCLLIWPSLSGLIIAAGLATVGIIELKASPQVLAAKAGIHRTLARNQLCLLGIIILYCAIQMITFSTEDAKNAALSPDTRAQLSALPDMQQSIDGMIEKWAALFQYGLYGAVILISVLCQGGLAYYYFSRRRIIEQFNASTPPWVLRLLEQFGR